DGVGVQGHAVTYQVSSSGTTTPTGTWVTSVPTTAPGEFLWTRTIITYTDASTTTMYSVAKHGSTGSPGTPGVSVVSITPYFRLGTTTPAKPTTNPPPDPWQTTEPAWVEGQMMYRTERIVYSSGSPNFAYTDVSLVAAFQAADAAMAAANGKNVVTYIGIGSWSSLPALPTTTGRITGDIHRVRYTDTGEIAAEYTIISGAWVSVKFGDRILTSLAVGKLSAGTSTIQTGVIEFLWTKVVNAKKITAEMLLIKGENLIADPNFLDTAVGGLVEQRCTYSAG